MAFTNAGFVIVPLGVILFLIAPDYLFWAFVVSLPLSQMVLMRVTAITFNLYPSFYLALLLLVRRLMDIAVDGQANIPRLRPSIPLALYIWVILLSLTMPGWIDGRAVAQPVDGPYVPFNPQPIRFNRANITQTLYPLFWALSYVILIREIDGLERLKRTIKVALVMACVVVVTGSVGQLLRFVGLGSLVYDAYAALGGGDLSFGIGRGSWIPHFYSVAGEPGWTSHYLLFALGLIASPAILGRADWPWGRRLNSIVLIAVMLALLVAGTTGYIGLAVFGVSALVLLSLRLEVSRWGGSLFRIIFFAGAAALLFVLLFRVADLSPSSYVFDRHIRKLRLETGSGPTRWLYARENLALFVRYPILGVGFGSSKSSSLITGLLSNIGFLGTFSFLWFNWKALRQVLRVYFKSTSEEFQVLAFSLSLSFLTLFGASLVAKSMGSLNSPWYWLLMAMMAIFPNIEDIECNV